MEDSNFYSTLFRKKLDGFSIVFERTVGLGYRSLNAETRNTVKKCIINTHLFLSYFINRIGGIVLHAVEHCNLLYLHTIECFLHRVHVFPPRVNAPAVHEEQQHPVESRLRPLEPHCGLPPKYDSNINEHRLSYYPEKKHVLMARAVPTEPCSTQMINL